MRRHDSTVGSGQSCRTLPSPQAGEYVYRSGHYIIEEMSGWVDDTTSL